MIDLHNKTIFLSGSGGVLGTAYISHMLQAGATVIGTELPNERADKLIGLFGSQKNFIFRNLDVTDENQICDIFKSLEADGIVPNVVINNAALTGELLMNKGQEFPDFAATTLDAWEAAMRVNLTGAFLLARQMDKDIVGKHDAKLINVASMYALRGPHHAIYEGMPFKSFAAYSASKAGIHGLTVWLASYWSGRNCTVNTIAPGAVNNNHSSLFRSRVNPLIMLDRMAEPSEIANSMMFLCSDASDYMNGQLLNVDGGFSAW